MEDFTLIIDGKEISEDIKNDTSNELVSENYFAQDDYLDNVLRKFIDTISDDVKDEVSELNKFITNKYIEQLDLETILISMELNKLKIKEKTIGITIDLKDLNFRNEETLSSTFINTIKNERSNIICEIKKVEYNIATLSAFRDKVLKNLSHFIAK